MRSIGIALLILIGGFISIYIIGALVPREHHVTIKAEFNRPPSEVWETIADFEKTPLWNKHLQSVKKLEPVNGHDVWLEVYDGNEFKFETIEWQPPHILARRILNTNLPYGGVWRFEVKPEANGTTTLYITEDGYIDGPLFRFAAKFLIGYAATIGGYMLAYAQKFGEKPEIKLVTNG